MISGRGCPFKRMIRKPRPQTVRVRRFARHVLRPGAVVQVWVTKPGEIGKYTRLRIRSGKRPVRVDRCLMPGSKRPVRCLGREIRGHRVFGSGRSRFRRESVSRRRETPD